MCCWMSPLCQVVCTVQRQYPDDALILVPGVSRLQSVNYDSSKWGSPIAHWPVSCLWTDESRQQLAASCRLLIHIGHAVQIDQASTSVIVDGKSRVRGPHRECLDDIIDWRRDSLQYGAKLLCPRRNLMEQIRRRAQSLWWWWWL